MPKMPKINIRSDKQIPEMRPPISQNIKEIIVHRPRGDDIQGHTTNSSSRSSHHYGHFKHEEQQAATALDDPTKTTSETIYKNSGNENLSDEAAEEQEHDKFTIYKSPHTVNLEGIQGIIMQAKQKQKETL